MGQALCRKLICGEFCFHNRPFNLSGRVQSYLLPIPSAVQSPLWLPLQPVLAGSQGSLPPYREILITRKFYLSLTLKKI